MAKALVLPFPRSKNERFVTRQANRAAELNPDACERHILQQVKIQADAMARRGISPDLIQRETRCLEAAIRAALWTAVMRPPGSGR